MDDATSLLIDSLRRENEEKAKQIRKLQADLRALEKENDYLAKALKLT